MNFAADKDIRRPVPIYTRENAPAAPKVEDLPLKESVSQYGITWTFEKPARAGQFINGDWYVVGPITVRSIDPKPLYGREIPGREMDQMDRERREDQRVRNGFMLDRWMCENDGEMVKRIKAATGKDHDKEWARQGQAWDAFVNEMWAKHRPSLRAPTDGWKQKHDDSYYRTAIEKSK